MASAQPFQKDGQGMELIDMVGRGVASEAEEEKTAGGSDAQLLESHGSPLQDGAARDIEHLEESVGGFGGGGVGAREDFGVSNDDALAAGDGVAEERHPDIEIG